MTNHRVFEAPVPICEDVTQRGGRVPAMTAFAEQAFQTLLPHFEHVLAAHLQRRTIDVQPHTNLRGSAYAYCPSPTFADKQLFMLAYMKQNLIQEVQGQLFGMSQSNANKWIHLYMPGCIKICFQLATQTSSP